MTCILVLCPTPVDFIFTSICCLQILYLEINWSPKLPVRLQTYTPPWLFPLSLLSILFLDLFRHRVFDSLWSKTLVDKVYNCYPVHTTPDSQLVTSLLFSSVIAETVLGSHFTTSGFRLTLLKLFYYTSSLTSLICVEKGYPPTPQYPQTNLRLKCCTNNYP